MTILFILLVSSRAANIDNAIADSMQTISFPIVTYPPIRSYLPPSRLNPLLILFRSWYARLTSITMDRISLLVASFTFVCKLDVREITSSAKVGKVRRASGEISKLLKFQESIREFEHGWHRVTSDKFGRSRTRSVPSLVDRNRLLPNWYEVKLQDLEQILLYPYFKWSFRRSYRSPNSSCILKLHTIRCLKFSEFFEVFRSNWDKRCKKSSLRIIYSRC